MSRQLILDVDTGTDDAVAIMFAALHPELELLAVTTVNGNVPVQHCTDNSLRVLDFIGRSDVPVHEGLSRPIVRLDFPRPKRYERDSEQDMHGTKLPLPDPTSSKHDTGAVEYLVETLRATTSQITLVPVGPLSNIAAALAIDPKITEAVDEVVIMGGGHDVGNETASAEFNIWADPEAAEMVFAAGFEKVTLVPLDATHQALVSADDCTRMKALGTPAGIAADVLIGRRVSAYTRGHGVAVADAAPVHDALCTAYLVEPKVISTRHLHVCVETQGKYTVGRTVIDTRTHDSLPPNCHVALQADAPLFVQQLMETFARAV
ncbi:nucleoside hydrolase [Angustibacter sp. Root456]|uniref:nucleoside hydrolase n=1 Tax=Angustibacter sp. Root456 TaxID=1736539 RepID=UPI0006F34044|nr:nucleoside hydrolase [Angustibacter sp. Root456]KQX69402.1 nucleoside hydrolase [Angustibacter sp. Root456]